MAAGLALAVGVGSLPGAISRWEQKRPDTEPAGFVAGLVHGAVMPCALPALVAGRDVTFYAANNTGRPYKIGYTAGVNACGAVFFGLVYRRISRRRTPDGPAPGLDR